MPTKPLPASADITHLKHQAKDLLADFRAAKISAFQRIREFHPKMAGLSDDAIYTQTFSLSDALLSIAREYGYPSWPRLKTVVAEATGQEATLNHNERITDDAFRQAVDFLDEGNAALLQKHLSDHPQLVHQKMVFEGGNYFSAPTLIAFVAENPFRQERLPGNIVDIARIILEAGAKDNQASLNETVGLVASGRIAREYGAQEPLIDLLCDYGADPNAGMIAALVHCERAAARRLLARGATLDISAAAALGMMPDVLRLLDTADAPQLQLALALAAQNNRPDAITALLAAGADPNRYNPPGGHSHCTALQSAIAEGHLEAVKVLVEAGADLNIRDIHHNAPALVWAQYSGSRDVFDYIKSKV
ncbi:MAG: ankyrin repeat domain-containing protein [Roseovarius sp.]